MAQSKHQGKAYAQMAFAPGPDFGKGEDTEHGTLVLCSTHHQGKFIQFYWAPRWEKSLVQGVPVKDCYDRGILEGNKIGIDSYYKGPRPPNLQRTLETYTDATHLFERVAYAFLGPDYSYMLFMHSYGPEHWVESSPYYMRDPRGPVHVYGRSSSMPVDHWFFYRITDNPDKETEDAINQIGINDWHLAIIDQWIGPMYKTTGISGQQEPWHLAYTPSAMPIAARRAEMLPMGTMSEDGMHADPAQALHYAPSTAPTQLTMDFRDHADPNPDEPMAQASCCPWSRTTPIADDDRKRPLME